LAVDASVLIYERIRDESRAGSPPLMAADHGFRRAMVSIMDANVTTLIAGAIMFQFGAGPVRGFAWSLSIGVFTSVFSAIVVSQVLLGLWFKRAKPKALPIIDPQGRGGWPLIKFVPAQTHFKFTRLAPIAAIVSGVLVLASAGSLATTGLNFGTDFAGGTVIETATAGPAPLAQLRAELGRSGVKDAQVQGFGSPNAALLRFKTPDGANAMDAANAVKTDLAKVFPGIQFTRVEVGRHGPGLGHRSDAGLHLVPLPTAVRPGRRDRHLPRPDPDGRDAVGPAYRVFHDLDRGPFDHHRLFDEREGHHLRPVAREPAQI
jgi:SecD/SecF fusion protein